MNTPHLVEVDQLTPLGSAILELTTCRKWSFHRAAELLIDRFEHDKLCSVSGLYSARMVREFYAERGEVVNPAPLPCRG